MTERLDSALAQMREAGRTGVIPYVTAGFPTAADTLAIVPALEAAGAVAIELGVPYSDPLADGPTIQMASQRAIEAGMTMHGCVDLVRQLRAAGVSVPLVLMGYYNPILSYGLETYAKDVAEAGADALIVPDLPPEEAGPLRDALRPHGLALVPLLAPTSTDVRIEQATRDAEGFVYCVSVAGVTGARSDLPEEVSSFVARVRVYTGLPVAVGFGVSERRHVEALGRFADAAVVGSGLISVIDSAPPGETATRAAAYVAGLVGDAG